MKKLILLSSMIIISCTNKNVGVSKVTNYELNNTAVSDTISFKVKNSNVNEFNSCIPVLNFFKKIKSDTLFLDKYDPILEIITDKRIIKFKNIDSDSENKAGYFNLGYNKKINKYLIYCTYNEYDEYLLVDKVSANIDTINGFPNFSPGIDKIVSFYINPYNDREIEGQSVFTGDIEVYTYNNKIRVILKQSFNLIPIEIRWKDDNTIIIRAISSIDYNDIVSKPGNENIDSKRIVYKKIILKNKSN